jgi:hypothetical protein
VIMHHIEQLLVKMVAEVKSYSGLKCKYLYQISLGRAFR